MSGNEYLTIFNSTANEWLCGKFSLDIRYIALKHGDTCELVCCDVSIWPIVRNAKNIEISTDKLAAGRLYIANASAESIKEILKNLTNGKLSVDIVNLSLNTTNPLSYYSDISSDRWIFDANLTIRGASFIHLPQAEKNVIDNELRCLRTPFDGLGDLLTFLNLTDIFSSHSQPFIGIRISPPIGLDGNKCKLTNNTLSLVLHAHPQLDINKVSLAIQSYPESPSGRKQLASKINWRNKDNLQIGSLKYKAKSFAIKMVLMTGKSPIIRHFFSDKSKAPNPRYFDLSLFDKDLKQLKRALFGTEPTDFEIAVNSLAYTLGFSGSVINETDAPDLLLTSPSGNLVVIECTTRTSDFDTKVGKLVERRSLIENEINEKRAESRKIYTYLVCSSSRKDIVHEPLKLAKHRVTLLSRENLEYLLTQLEFFPDLEKMLIDDERELDAILSAQQTSTAP